MSFRNIVSVVACLCLVGAMACKKSSLPAASTYPTITDFSPKSGAVGITVTLTGSGFDGVTNVTVGGAQATFQHINFNSLTLQIPWNAASGIIAVVNSEGSGGTNDPVTGLPASFYVTPQVAIATDGNGNYISLTNETTPIYPASGSPGTSVLITGYGLSSVTQVVFGNGAPANYVINNANLITATVPLVASTGPITLTAPAMGGTTLTTSSPTFTFSLGGAAAPVLTSFSPAQAAVGDQVTLTGSGFSFLSAVTIGGVGCYATPTQGTTLTITVPAAAVSGVITVTNGLGSSSSATPLYVIPVIDSFSPAQGPAGTLVTLKGSGFMGATSIAIGNAAPTPFLVLDANTAQVNVAPASATGVITVAAPGSVSGQSAGTFTFIPSIAGLPTFTAIPASASVGDVISLTGTGFLSVTDVFVGNVPDAVATFTATDDSDLTLTVPANAQTGFISATNNVGTVASGTTLIINPTITAVAPLAGPVGTTVSITGTGFVGTTSVTFGGGVAASFVVVDANHINAQVPAGATSGVVTVVSSGVSCQSSTNYSFTVQP